jgi:hypothetical protein
MYMLHGIMGIFSYDTHTVHGAWAVIGTVVLIVVLLLIGLRIFRPASSDQFDEHELEALLAMHTEANVKMPSRVVDV